MDRDELIFEEYKLYAKQKDNFIDRNFCTNRFYMISFLAVIIAMIFTGNVIFMERFSATLLFSATGIAVCVLWWMNVDSYTAGNKYFDTSLVSDNHCGCYCSSSP